ncbi:MAG: hypothetical protein ACI4I4_04780 [Acutalibacteraceae bacterium]
MTKAKKRIICVAVCCVLFAVSAGVTYLVINWNSIFTAPSPYQNTHSDISFPNAVSAKAEFRGVPTNGIAQGNIIEMEFPDKESAKKLYELEQWANDYEDDKTLKIIPWEMTVTYALSDGETVQRKYRKFAREEMLADFIEKNKENISATRSLFPDS